MVRTLLKVPWLSRVIGKRSLTPHVVDRESGTVYQVPLAHTRHGDTLLIGTSSRPWVRNPRPALGHRHPRPEQFDQVVHTTEADVLRLFAIVAGDNKPHAEFNGIGFGPGGSPNKVYLYQTWQ
ncbi:hypothetical protein DFR74_102755 [Nocardia puris]|uniref:Deazaflavin-dependent oxidoreductase (Nitroreductase family) n=1 Tax=Nocardia puris TaxID=208602 RepID=A0A366DW85_9NOCA|nr:hypothetical protein DFR74_102755 [Nocardia puris]